MDDSDVAIASAANFVVIALTDLVHCLKNRGALGDRQYEAALRSTIEKADDSAGLDYRFLAALLQHLERQHPGDGVEETDHRHRCLLRARR
jgi:hypothetical protein